MLNIIDNLGLLMWHILPSIVTVLFAGYLLQKFFVSKSNAAHFIDSILVELKQLKSDASEYWNNPSDARDNVLSSNIKGLLHTINSDIIYYCNRYSKKSSNFSAMMLHLHSSVTGGDFESKKRKADQARYLTIVNDINKFRSELHKTKI